MNPTGSQGVKNRDVEEQLRLRIERISSRIVGRENRRILSHDVEQLGLDTVDG
jgi:hypothetical protein